MRGNKEIKQKQNIQDCVSKLICREGVKGEILAQSGIKTIPKPVRKLRITCGFCTESCMKIYCAMPGKYE